MATIIAPADFQGQNNIPDKDLVSANLQNNFINKYEPMFLTELLGDDLYASLKADPTAPRMIALIPYFKPAIVDYVYWFYLEDMSIQNLGTGAAQPKKQNSVTVSPYPKIVKAWNEMVELNKKTNKFLKDNPDYTEYTIVLPSWYFCNGLYPFFDWHWYSFYGCNLLPSIYRVKNSLGL